MSLYTRFCAMWRRPGALSAVGLIVVTALLAGCGGTSSNSASSSTSNPSGAASSASATTTSSTSADSAVAANVAKFTGPVTSYPAVAAVKNVSSLKGKTVWFVPIGEAVPIVAAMGNAMTTALGDVGVKVHLCDGQLLPTTIASCLNQAVTQGASAVVTAYVDYKMAPTAINNVVGHKIPLLVAGEANDSGSTSKLLGFYNTNIAIAELARLAVDSAIADGNGKAQMLYIGASDSPALLGLNADAAQEAKQQCASCAFHVLTYLTPDIQKVPSQISAALVRYPSTNYIVVGEDTALQQVVQGVNSAGYDNKVKITAVDGSLAPMQIMKSGDLVTQDVGVSADYLGWGFADGILRLMTGQQPAVYLGDIRVFDKQNVGGLQLTPAAYATNAWYGSAPFEGGFLNAWSGK